MIHDDVAIIINHHFYLPQIRRLNVVLFQEVELFSVPYIFCISALTNHMDMYGFMLMAEEHKYKSKGSKYFRHTSCL